MNEQNVKVKVTNLTKKFGDLLVLDDISFEVKEGEFLCIVEPTGCGKTTFLNSLTRRYDITAGEIPINGEPVNLKKHNIACLVLTNKPAKIKEQIKNDLPRPRSVAPPDFVKIRNEVTDLIKWWQEV